MLTMLLLLKILDWSLLKDPWNIHSKAFKKWSNNKTFNVS